MECRDSILSNEYYDVITDYALSQPAEEKGVACSINISNFYNMVYVSKWAVSNPNDYFFNHRSVPKLYGLMQEPGAGGVSFDPNSLIVSGITQVQREPLSLTGKGCVIVIIDTGIDYTSPVFRNPDGSSRILAIWDQTIQTGTAPEGFFTAVSTAGRTSTVRCSRITLMRSYPAGTRTDMAAIWRQWLPEAYWTMVWTIWELRRRRILWW